MRSMTCARAAVLCAAAVFLYALSAASDNSRVLDVVGRGAEGRTPYRGGGRVKFLSASMQASLVHFAGGGEIPAKIEISYEVLQKAPILLDSRLGSEYWSLYNYTTGDLSRLHSRERIDLQDRGQAATQTPGLTIDVGRRSPLKKGLCGIRGRSYFLIVDRKTDNWLDVCDPNAFWQSPQVNRELTFTLANLDEFKLKLEGFASTWKPGDAFRVMLSVEDADGENFPVPRAEVTALPEAAGGNHPAIHLRPLYDSLNAPTGYYEGTLPDVSGPIASVVVEAKVLAETARGALARKITTRFPSGYGKVSGLAALPGVPQLELRRTPDGKLVETRAVWIHVRDYATPEATDAMILRIKKANLNVVIPIVYVRGYVMFKTDKLPMEGEVAQGFDPLAYLIEKCHAAGLEVHPWFCNAYFGAERGGSHGPGFERYPQFAVVGKGGKPFATVSSQVPADLHNPEYQKFNVDMMLHVARNYKVDGLHFDYIRTMTDCYCQRCRHGFEKLFGHTLEEATNEEWVKWNQDAVGKIVREVSQRAREIRQGITISAAVFANLKSGGRQGQNAPQWADAGYLDVVLPMDYTMDTFELRKNEQSFLDAMKDDAKLATGISIYLRSGGRVTSRDPSLVLEQVAMVRSLGIQGFCFFCYDHLSDEILEALRAGPCAEPAVPVFRVAGGPRK
jgi:uncharacterized lipoprotein YddW (UPF0748 family)